jgi:hypothetical protein
MASPSEEGLYTEHSSVSTLQVETSPSVITTAQKEPQPLPLVQNTNGVFYGKTVNGGTAGDGVFYSFTEGLAPFVTFLPRQSLGKVGRIYRNPRPRVHGDHRSFFQRNSRNTHGLFPNLPDGDGSQWSDHWLGNCNDAERQADEQP